MSRRSGSRSGRNPSRRLLILCRSVQIPLGRARSRNRVPDSNRRRRRHRHSLLGSRCLRGLRRDRLLRPGPVLGNPRTTKLPRETIFLVPNLLLQNLLQHILERYNPHHLPVLLRPRRPRLHPPLRIPIGQTLVLQVHLLMRMMIVLPLMTSILDGVGTNGAGNGALRVQGNEFLGSVDDVPIGAEGPRAVVSGHDVVEGDNVVASGVGRGGRVPVGGVPNHGGHVGSALLELVQDVIERHVLGDAGDLANGQFRDRDVVPRAVEAHQALDEQEPDDVRRLPGVDGDPAVPAGQNPLHGPAVQPRGDVDGEGVSDGRHGLTCGLLRELQGARNDRGLVVAQLAAVASLVAVHVHQRPELGPAEEQAVPLAQQPVQHFAQRVGHGEHDEEEDSHQGSHGGAHGQPVPGADGLGEDLAEHEEERDGQDDGHVGFDDGVQEEREGLHGHGVAHQEGHQQEVLVSDHGKDLFRVLLVVGLARLPKHLQVHQPQRHEPQRQPRHEPREGQQPHDRPDVDPERVFAAVLLYHPPHGVPASSTLPFTLCLSLSIYLSIDYHQPEARTHAQRIRLSTSSTRTRSISCWTRTCGCLNTS
ncbi:hypothetical protein Mapa_006020 [Marchantia paleacea]|nr:hypothetical protein Mapa_006020 [Marchantia paleacea]